MKLTIGDAITAAVDSARGFRWVEYAPLFLVLAVELIFLAVTTQLQAAWAMSIVAPVTRWVNGANNLHYPAFFGYLSYLMGWIESFLYAVPGAVLIPLALLRIYSRSDRALSLGAGAASRLAGAVLPTLIAALLGVGVTWGWQRFGVTPIATAINPFVVGYIGPHSAWLLALLGGYVVTAILLYVPVAAVQARATFFGSLARGVRFGLRALPLTLVFLLLFALPAIIVQFLLERMGSVLVVRLQPESMALFLGIYALLANLATYFSYGTAARLYRMARGDD